MEKMSNIMNEHHQKINIYIYIFNALKISYLDKLYIYNFFLNCLILSTAFYLSFDFTLLSSQCQNFENLIHRCI